jgi:sortase A
MNLTRRHRLLPPRSQGVLRRLSYLMFITGIVALAYVGFALLEARSYQVSAKHALDNQVLTAANTKIPQTKAVIHGGDVLGRLDIPRLGMSVAVLQGTASRVLRLGAGHIEATALPGEPGNSGIAGHRDTFFRGLRNIRNNDDIQLQTATVHLHYQVDWIRIVSPNDTAVLDSSSPDSTITLVTCYPFYFVGPAPKRFVVHAHKN